MVTLKKKLWKVINFLSRFSWIERLWQNYKVRRKRDYYLALTKATPLNNVPLVQVLNCKDIVIHVGFGHCGTTVLEDTYFPFHPDICYWGKPFPEQLDIAYNILSYHDDCNFNLGEVKNVFLRMLKDTGKVNLLSAEGFTLTTVSYFGGIHAGRRRVAERLRQIFSGMDVKIMFTIRRQVDALRAAYFHYANKFKWYHMKTPVMERWLLNQLEWHQRVITDLHMFQFYSVIKTYEELFGKGKIGIFLLEDLKRDPKMYFHNICRFIGVPYSEQALSNVRQVNVTQGRKFTGFYETLIKQFYLDENKKLFSYYDLGADRLKALNYI